MIDHNQQISFPQLDELIAAAPEAETRQPAEQVNATARLTMSSLQIAEITGKEHRIITRDIRLMLIGLYGEEEVEKTIPEQYRNRHSEYVNNNAEALFKKVFETFQDGPNLDHPKTFQSEHGFSWKRDARGYICEFSLDYQHTLTLTSGYSVKLRKAIIDRWHELESRPAAPVNLNDPGFLRGLLMDYTERVLTLETTVSELSPKAEALEKIAGCDGLMNITNAAKVLQVKPKDLFRYLDSHGWTYRRPGSSERVPYQNRIAQGYMVAKAHRGINDQTGEEFIKERALLTPKGLARLAELKIAG